MVDENFASLVSRCLTMKFIASDGKLRETDCAAIEELFQILQKIPALHRRNQGKQRSHHGGCGIYAIINTVTKEQYIGSSSDIPTRYLHHRSELRRSKHISSKLQAAWTQYGEDAFVLTILEEVAEANELADREQFYLERDRPVYNIAQSATNAATLPPIDEGKLRRLMAFLEQDANILYTIPFLQHIQFAIAHGIVTPGENYPLLLQAEKAKIATWEAFQQFVTQA